MNFALVHTNSKLILAQAAVLPYALPQLPICFMQHTSKFVIVSIKLDDE